jgi:transposase
MRVGCPWRGLPEALSDWSAVCRRFNLWSKKEVLTDVFVTLRQLFDKEWIFIDWCLYKYRHQVENVFSRLKHYRAIAKKLHQHLSAALLYYMASDVG